MNTEPVTSLRPPAWDVVDWMAHWERLAVERDRLATEKAQLEAEIEALTDQREALVGDVTHRTRRKAALDEELRQLSFEVDAKRGAIRLLDAEDNASAVRGGKLDDEVRRLQSERDALQSEAERVRADLDARSAELDARHEAATKREAELDAKQIEFDSRVAAFESERSAWRTEFQIGQDQLGSREKSLKKAEKKLESDKAHNGCFATFFAPFLIVLGALIGSAVVAGLILL